MRTVVNIFRRGAAMWQLEIAPSQSVPGVSFLDDYRTPNRFPTAHVALADATPIGSSGYAVSNAFSAFRDNWERPAGKMRSAAWLTVGSSRPSRSHTFEQNRIDGGGDSYAAVNSGWVNRFAKIAPQAFALDLLSIGNGASRSIIGGESRYAAAISTIPTIVVANADRARLMMTGDPATTEALVARAAAQSVGDTITALDTLVIPPLSSLVGVYPKGADRFQTIARLLIAGVPARYINCDISGWDHHKNMGGSENSPSGPREHADMMTSFNGGIAALIVDLEHAGIADRVLITTQSEFSRTMRQNGAEGADHGTSTHGYAWGTAVTSGLYGAPLDYREYSSIYMDAGSWQDRGNNRLLNYSFDYRDWQRMQAEWLLERPMTPEEISQVWGYVSNPPAEQWKISHV